MATSQLTFKQNLKIKSLIVDINHRLNQILPAFDNLNKELSPGFRLVDTFSNHFSFKHKDAKARTAHLNKLENVYRASKDDPNTLFIISDASLKNNVATSVTHIQRGQALITKAIYHAMNISTTEAELFAIGRGISQAAHTDSITNIAVVRHYPSCQKNIRHFVPSIPATFYFISRDLRAFFSRDPRNSITFWNCPSDDNWPPHHLVDKESKSSRFNPILPSKPSWDHSRKDKCNSIIQKWQMYFQASDYRGKNFLDLNDDDDKPIQPSYSKGGAWLKHFSLSNSLCARVTRLITNHAPIGEYRIGFFPNEPSSCPCGQVSLETRDHILHNCERYQQSWNPKQDSLKDILTFLDSNPGAFCFQEGITYLLSLSVLYIVLHLLLFPPSSFFLSPLLT